MEEMGGLLGWGSGGGLGFLTSWRVLGVFTGSEIGSFNLDGGL